MIFQGKVRKVGDHIDTDAIIPARFLVTTDRLELGRYCMEGLSPGWAKETAPGDILVGGRNFGCGSSREHAPLAILGNGISVVLASSFARIFYRNSFNMGLLLLELGEQIENIADNDELTVDSQAGLVHNITKGIEISAPAIPDFMAAILEKGGLVPFAAERLRSRAG